MLASTSLLWIGGLLPLVAVAQKLDHASTVICIPENPVDSVLSYYISSGDNPFCMNGGTCKENFVEDLEFPCNCPTGLTGPHCEFEDGIVPDCDLDCFNGGQCQVGIKYPSDTIFESNEDLQYCICPDEYYGKRCEVEGKRCGVSHCFNGGSCVQITQDDGSTTDHCDCTSAGDADTSFAGRFCQSASSVFCSKFSDHNGQHFCVNGGECRSDSYLGCDCPEDFTGPVCEFHEQHEQDHAECNLQCQNNGICRKGAKDLSFLDKFGVSRRENDANEAHNEDFEHCACPIGYVGLTCEFRLDVCPGGTHVCMHGAECVPHVDEEANLFEFQCDCNNADDHDLRYAGHYCQFSSTEFCTDNGARPLDGTEAFCTNGGECKSFVGTGEDHPGCNCFNMFGGPHCEMPPSWDYEEEPETKGGMAISLTLGLFFLLLFCIVVVVYQRRKRFEMAFRPTGDAYYKDYEENFHVANAPTFSEVGAFDRAVHDVDVDAMIDEMSSHGSPTGLIGIDDTSSTMSDVPSEIRSESATSDIPSMSSLESTESASTTFREDATTGRAMVMKDLDFGEQLSV